MMKSIIAVGMLLVVSTANASLISLESMSIIQHQSVKSSTTLANYWQSLLQSGNQPNQSLIDVFADIRSGRNMINLLTIVIPQQNDADTLEIVAGIDAHYGAEAYVNNENFFSQRRDLWWKLNFGHHDVVTLSDILLASGETVIQIYWAERCCNGPNSFTFSYNQSTPEFLSEAALNAHLVNTPASLWLFLSGLLGVMLNRFSGYKRLNGDA